MSKTEKKEYFAKKKAERLAYSKAKDKAWERLNRNIMNEYNAEVAKAGDDKDKILKPRNLSKNLIK